MVTKLHEPNIALDRPNCRIEICSGEKGNVAVEAVQNKRRLVVSGSIRCILSSVPKVDTADNLANSVGRAAQHVDKETLNNGLCVLGA